MLRKFIAFTLAEVLITLGIIGVVAAITIPALISDYQKRSTVTQLKKTYSTISQAVRMSEAENGELAGWHVESCNYVDFFDVYIAPFLKVSKSTASAGALVYYSPGGIRDTRYAIFQRGAAVYTLLSGAQIMIVRSGVVSTQQTDTRSRLGLLIDLNGYKTPPNRFGRDTFWMSVESKKGLALSYLSDGEDITKVKTREQLKNGPSADGYQCNKTGRGGWCGALIEKDGWTIAPDYPW
ncbi:MAG: hypothetical protein NC191_01440 [Muribaculaceae bacterium]|nr:hypothetical protein [Muribaculaceae bacterium]